jgi:hypothetical protein
MGFRSISSRLPHLAATVLLSANAIACPLCHSQTGRQVRTGIFNSTFGLHLIATLAPFPVLVGVVALIYFGPPKVKRP